jgi:hypothetical protein
VFPVNKIRAYGMRPMRLLTVGGSAWKIGRKGVVIVENMIFTFIVEQTNGIVDPPFGYRIMELRAIPFLE